MKQTYSYKEKWKQFGWILLPIFITQLSMFAMNFFDTVMSGHASPEDLAGVAIGSSIWVPVFTGLSGILICITTIVAHLIGAKKKDEIPYQVVQGIFLSVAIAVSVFLLGLFFLNPILHQMELSPKVRDVAHGYLVALSFGLIPVFISTVLRCFVDALGKTSVTMMVTLLSLPINIVFNYILIFGKLGFPAMGGVGAGIATSITYWCLLLTSVWVTYRYQPFSNYQVFRKFYPVSLATWKEQLKIGIPVGLSIFLETSIFAAVTLFMSGYSTATIAGHQAAINFATLLYMIPMSISMALTIAVGFEIGGNRFRDAKVYSYIGMGIAISLAVVNSILLLAFREKVAAIYTTDHTVLALTVKFLFYAVFFQLWDGIAAPIQGALRGYKDVNVPFLVALISYWVLGLPIGIGLAKYTSMGPYGYWVGLISGLAFGAVFLFFRLRRIQKVSILNLVMDRPTMVGK